MASRVACLSSALLRAVWTESGLLSTVSSSTPSPLLWTPVWCTVAPIAKLWNYVTITHLSARWLATRSTLTGSWPTCPSCLASKLTWIPAARERARHQRATPHPASKRVSVIPSSLVEGVLSLSAWIGYRSPATIMGVTHYMSLF